MEISIYQGHNSSLSFYCNNKYHVLELEKFSGFKNLMLIEQEPSFIKKMISDIFKLLKNKFDYFGEVETLILGKDWNQVDELLIDEIKPNIVKYYDHHLGHAASGFYQSDFEDALIVSFDGGGNDGFMNFYSADKFEGLKRIEKNFDYNLGTPYLMAGYPISEISNKTGYLIDDLKISGKIMGLAGYGEENERFMCDLYDYYLSSDFSTKLNQKDEFSGKTAFDFAYCNQKVFEKIFLQIFYSNLLDFFSKTKSKKNICLTGGCALNVLMNQRLSKQGFDVFVPPNPDDGGLSLGFLFLHKGENKKNEVTFNGIPILDEHKFDYYYLERFKNKKVDYHELVHEVSNGKIIGIIEGDGEVGPRALGRRSIICDPSISDMKDILNNKVKFREWFRPFAPVARDKDAHEYFEIDSNNPERYKFMSFAPRVKEKYKKLLPSITHVDGTSRLQVIMDKSETLYKILNQMELENKIPVLINTSFNTKGKPTLTTYREAFDILQTTELDFVYSNEYLFYK